MQEELTVYANKLVESLHNATIHSRLCHWNVRGSNFYEFHLLFERIYSELDGLMDGFIEVLRSMQYSPTFDSFRGLEGSLPTFSGEMLAEHLLQRVMTVTASTVAFNDFCSRAQEEDPRMVGLCNRLQGIADSTLSLQYLLRSSLSHRL